MTVIPPIDLVLAVLMQLITMFASLAGVAALVAVLVQLGKFIGLIKDDTAHKWAAGLNLVAFIVFAVFGIFNPNIVYEVLDGYAAQIAAVALFVLGFLTQMTTSKPFYTYFKNARVPYLGYSNPRE